MFHCTETFNFYEKYALHLQTTSLCLPWYSSILVSKFLGFVIQTVKPQNNGTGREREIPKGEGKKQQWLKLGERYLGNDVDFGLLTNIAHWLGCFFVFFFSLLIFQLLIQSRLITLLNKAIVLETPSPYYIFSSTVCFPHCSSLLLNVIMVTSNYKLRVRKHMIKNKIPLMLTGKLHDWKTWTCLCQVLPIIRLRGALTAEIHFYSLKLTELELSSWVWKYYQWN